MNFTCVKRQNLTNNIIYNYKNIKITMSLIRFYKSINRKNKYNTPSSSFSLTLT